MFSVASDLVELLSATLFFQLLFCTINIAIFLLAIESDDQIFSVTSLVSFIALSTVLVSIFIYCKLSENITGDLNDIGDVFYESAWYRMPLDQQKMFLRPIERAQKGIRLMGFGMVECSLAMFLSV